MPLPPSPDPEKAVPTDPCGLMIIRAWIEDGSSEPLRAQIRISTDVSAGFERTVSLARAEDVSTTVQGWLADMLSHVARPG